MVQPPLLNSTPAAIGTGAIATIQARTTWAMNVWSCCAWVHIHIRSGGHVPVTSGRCWILFAELLGGLSGRAGHALHGHGPTARLHWLRNTANCIVGGCARRSSTKSKFGLLNDCSFCASVR